MPEPLGNAHAVTKLPAQDLERARVFYRDKLGLEPVEERTGGLPKGSGELGTFFYDSKGNLIGIAQPISAGAARG